MEYLLKASSVIFIFYACYKLFLHRETFFETNRWFLLIGLVTAVFIPFVVIPVYIEYIPLAHDFIIENDGFTTQTTIKNSLDLQQIGYTIYGIGVLFFLIKLGIEFSSLARLIKKNKFNKKGTFTFIETDDDVPPFSFFKHIVYNKNHFNDTELEHIINHEKVHASQYHSIDILLLHIASILFWFNPFIWLYKKEIQQNLEFIADKEAQTISNCQKSYQNLLLKASIPNYHLVLANNFYNSLIKKRIVMLHKSKSNKSKLWKFALVLPIMAIFLMSANTKEIYIEKALPVEEQVSIADPSIENQLNDLLKTTNEEEPISVSSKELKTSNVNSEKGDKINLKKGQDPKAPKIAKTVNDHEMAMITKDFTDADFESLKNQLNEEGVTVKFKGIKRNNNNEITAIKIDVSSKKSNANYHTESDDPIRPIKIGYNSDGSNISIGNSNVWHSGDQAYAYTIKDGKAKIHTTGKADNVFVIAGDDDDEKVVIKNIDKVHFSPKAKSKVHFISEDGNVTKIDGENIVIRETEVGDIDTIHVKRINKGNMVWINKDDDNEVIEIEKGNDDKFFISTDEGKKPLYILNGKEIGKKEMDELKPESIEKVEVLKGDSASEKYGDKGKNGVIVITTKDKE